MQSPSLVFESSNKRLLTFTYVRCMITDHILTLAANLIKEKYYECISRKTS